MVIKIGRKEFILTENDKIFHNGSVALLMTQTVFDGWRQVNPTISKAVFKQLLKNGNLQNIKEEEYESSNGTVKMIWYRFKEV